MYQNATREQIITALQEGKSIAAISRELRADRGRIRQIRADLNLPVFVRVEQTRTIEQKWALFAQPADGGHVKWTGERGTSTGTPLLSYRDHHHSAAAIAFRIKHGRSPDGYVVADCGMKHCVAPDHVDDEAGRMAACGTAYRNVRSAVAAMLRTGVPEAHIARELHVAARTVAAVRNDLGLPTPKPGRRPQQCTVEDAFLARVTPLDGGHARWSGKTTKSGLPIVKHRGEELSGCRVAFRLHYGRAPEGLVRPGCGMAGCVAGSHLEDRIVRERTAAAFEAIFPEVAA